MADLITSAISERICKHMNDDHAEAVLVYAKVFGNSPNSESAKMLSIDPEGMDLSTIINGENKQLRITFDHVLQDSEDAHQTLITMVKTARQTSVAQKV
jgi:putative heme iron utilization protein